MEDTTDLVLSDVHVFMEPQYCNSDDVKKHTAIPYKIITSRFEISIPTCSKAKLEISVEKDNDDDFIINARSVCTKDVIYLEHAMATKLSDVGLQVWNGAILMSDFVLCNRELFCNKSVLELGCGVGLVAICLAMSGAEVIATDLNQNYLDLCQSNALKNEHLFRNADTSGSIKTQVFDWNEDFQENSNFPKCDIIVAADVIYDTVINDLLFKQIVRLCNGKNNVVFLGLEKRLNFTLSHMDIACPAYENFTNFLSHLSRDEWLIEQIDVDNIMECFNVERSLQMELWKLSKI